MQRPKFIHCEHTCALGAALYSRHWAYGGRRVRACPLRATVLDSSRNTCPRFQRLGLPSLKSSSADRQGSATDAFVVCQLSKDRLALMHACIKRGRNSSRSSSKITRTESSLVVMCVKGSRAATDRNHQDVEPCTRLYYIAVRLDETRPPGKVCNTFPPGPALQRAVTHTARCGNRRHRVPQIVESGSRSACGVAKGRPWTDRGVGAVRWDSV